MPFAKVSDLARLALVAAQYRELVGEAIRARRKEMGLTQPQLADRVETYLREHGKREDGNPFDAQNISRWERGKNLATTDNLEAVAHSLETTAGEMLAQVHAAREGVSDETPDLLGAINGDAPGDIPPWAQELLRLVRELTAEIAEGREELTTVLEYVAAQATADARRGEAASARGEEAA